MPRRDLPHYDKIRGALETRATVQIAVEPEWDRPEDHFDDPDVVARIREQIAAGNEWAWCVVTVRVLWREYRAEDSLSGCSYQGVADFGVCGYYSDMRAECLDRLADKVADAYDALSSLIDQ